MYVKNVDVGMNVSICHKCAAQPYKVSQEEVTQLKCYKLISILLLTHGSEIRTMTKKAKCKQETPQTRLKPPFLNKGKRGLWDYHAVRLSVRMCPPIITL